MQLFSLPFLIFVIVGLTLFHSCWTFRQRQAIFLLLNAVFLSSHVESLKHLVPLAAYVGLCVLSIHLVNYRKSRTLFISCLAMVLIVFLYLKCYVLTILAPKLPMVYSTIGLSYILFRALHVLIDTYQDEEVRDDFELVSLLNYLISFLSLTAGPIQRYDDFRRQESAWERSLQLSVEMIRGAFVRVTTGYIKLVFAGTLALELHTFLLKNIDMYLLAFSGAAFAYILHVYLNFSGYMDIAIGLGKLFGLELPENFNAPLLATSFLDLWNRWHMTLSSWFKTYLFGPLIRFLCQRWETPWVLPYYGVIAYFIVFFLLGLWHGSEPRYMVLGLFLGLGAGVNKLFEVEMTRRLGAGRYQALRRQGWYQALGRALGLSYFAFVVAVAWETFPGLSECGTMLAALGVGGIVVNFAAAVFMMTVLSQVATAVHSLSQRAVPWPSVNSWRPSQAALSLGIRLTLLLFIVRGKLENVIQQNQQSGARAANEPYLKKTEVFYGRF